MNSEQRANIRTRFHSYSKAIKTILKEFQYDANIPHADNMTKLCACLQSVLDCDFVEDFCRYLSDPDALPIEINFKTLRVENLSQMLEDWLNSLEETSQSPIQHEITVKFRNILFKQIMLEERQTIDDYFETLSENNRLKGFDLYQLLQTILSSYHLYEFNADTVSFFEKINSFENFTNVVEAFIGNGRRVIIKDKLKPDDYKYIRRFQFDQLLEFWENQNEQLSLMHYSRKNHADFGTQTTIVNCTETETQVENIHQDYNYLDFVNNSLHQVNRLIEIENSPQILFSLNRVFDVLRREKIVATTFNTQNPQKHHHRPSICNSHPNKSKSPLRTPRSRSPIPSKNKGEGEIKKIFQFLLLRGQQKKLTISELQIFLYQIRLVKAHENYLIRNLMDNHLIEDPDDITYDQFKTTIQQLIKESDRLSIPILKEYIGTYIEEQLQKTHHMGSHRNRVKFPHAQRQYYGLLQNKPTVLLSRTTFQLDSEQY